jgi:hypothetical protein
MDPEILGFPPKKIMLHDNRNIQKYIQYLRILNLFVSEKVHIFYRHDITEILLKVALNTITLTRRNQYRLDVT